VRHRTLVILGHPSPEDSRVNRHLADSVRGLPDVSVRDLAAVRGATGFDVAAEQEALRAHGTVVLQFPWYWHSVPGILKEWMDQVLTYGFAYGTGGDALHGKRGMALGTPFVLHGARAVDDAALAAHAVRYRSMLTGATSGAQPV
jgi:glutathione-regulated potassium-efflux system ancillary protein KefG